MPCCIERNVDAENRYGSYDIGRDGGNRGRISNPHCTDIVIENHPMFIIG